ncbi:MAG: glutamate synthase central domain-containing protein [Thiolinea sp.]
MVKRFDRSDAGTGTADHTETPIISNREIAKLKQVDRPGFRCVTLPILFDAHSGPAALEQALDQLFAQADAEIANGANLIILSDRGTNADHAPIPSLLAVGGLHHHLIRNGNRTRISIILESGEPREVHHFAVLLGYGAQAINPYAACETIDDLIREGYLTGIEYVPAVLKYIKAATRA